MASTFKLNPGIVKELGGSSGVTAEIQKVADEVIGLAASNSNSRRFSSSLEILNVGAGDQGTVITVGTRWSFGHFIEWGSVNQAPQAPLRKAVSSLGLKFEEA
jgi:hypothetical protein